MQKQYDISYKKSFLSKVKSNTYAKAGFVVGLGAAALQTFGFNNFLLSITSGLGVAAGAWLLNKIMNLEADKTKSIYAVATGIIASFIVSFLPFTTILSQFTLSVLVAGIIGLISYYQRNK